MKIRANVILGPEGTCLSIEDGNDNANRTAGRRVCGPKPWGGGRVIHSFMVEADELRLAIDEAERMTTVSDQ